MSVDRPDEDLAARLGAYLDGELPPAEAAEVEGLLFRDAAAGQLYRGMKADRALLSAEDTQTEEEARRAAEAALESDSDSDDAPVFTLLDQ